MTTEIDFILRLKIRIFCVGSSSFQRNYQDNEICFLFTDIHQISKTVGRNSYSRLLVVLTTNDNINNSISGNVLNTEKPLLVIDFFISSKYHDNTTQ